MRRLPTACRSFPRRSLRRDGGGAVGGGVLVVRPEGQETTASVEMDKSVTPETVWDQDAVATYNAFTLPEKAMLDEENGSIGVLSIPALGLSVNVYEAEDEMEAMSRGVAHFKSTSAYDGNVGLSAHNINFDGTDGYFKNLHTLKTGDTVSYKTALGEREHEVSLVKTISETDWSYLSRSTENRLTMVTCISGKPTQRVLVQAIQK
jgi:LPXTG-site transpeptidase (sortase) family protein